MLSEMLSEMPSRMLNEMISEMFDEMHNRMLSRMLDEISCRMPSRMLDSSKADKRKTANMMTTCLTHLYVEKLGWRAWIVHTKLYGRSDYLSTFCSGSFGHAKPTTQGVQYNEECRFSIQQRSDETNIELSSIYLEIWPHYIGN